MNAINDISITINIINGIARVQIAPLDNADAADAADAAAFAIENADSRFRQRTVHNMIRYFGSHLAGFHYAQMAELIVAKYHAWGYPEVHNRSLPLDIAKRIITQDAKREGGIIKIGRGLYRIA